MEQKDKDLLLKDLCARLPYGIKITYPLFRVKDGKNMGNVPPHELDLSSLVLNNLESIIYNEIKPYLRPMSSMTKEEDKEWQIYKNNIACACDENLNERINELYDWFNKHHFDFRGLIEKNLALKAPKDMYNIYE